MKQSQMYQIVNYLLSQNILSDTEKQELESAQTSPNTLRTLIQKHHPKIPASYLQSGQNQVNLPKPKIGISQDFFIQGIDPLIRKRIDFVIQALKQDGFEFVDIDLPFTKYAVSVYYMTMSTEVASNLERIDGVRYAEQFVSVQAQNQKIKDLIQEVQTLWSEFLK